MPVYFFWGEDDFSLMQAVKKLQQQVVAADWIDFNFDRFSCYQTDFTIEGLNQIMTPPFGMPGRLVWIEESSVATHSSKELVSELQRTLPVISPDNHLLFTSGKKPDARLKSTKLLKEYAEFKEFFLIKPWERDAILKQIKDSASQFNLKLTSKAAQVLADSVGNNTRQLWNELEKLSIYHQNKNQPIDDSVVSALVNSTTSNTLHLVEAISLGKLQLALDLVVNLINLNEPPLRIVATLVGQFRTLAIIKLHIELEETDDKVIAQAASVKNFKRIYFLRKQVQSLSSRQLMETLPILLDLECSLKEGIDPLSVFKVKVIELCSLFSKHS